MNKSPKKVCTGEFYICIVIMMFILLILSMHIKVYDCLFFFIKKMFYKSFKMVHFRKEGERVEPKRGDNENRRVGALGLSRDQTSWCWPDVDMVAEKIIVTF